MFFCCVAKDSFADAVKQFSLKCCIVLPHMFRFIQGPTSILKPGMGFKSAGEASHPNAQFTHNPLLAQEPPERKGA